MNISPFALPPAEALAPPSWVPSPRPNSVSEAWPVPLPPSTKNMSTELPLIGRLQKFNPSVASNMSVS